MVTDALPVPGQDVELVRLRSDAAKVLVGAQEIGVTTDEARDYGVAYLKEIRTVKKAAEARRDALVRPLNDAVRVINAFVKDLLLPVEEADRLLGNRLLAYDREQKAKAEAERRRQEAERLRLEAEAMAQAAEAQRKLEEAVRLEREAQRSRDAAIAQAAEASLREAVQAEHAAQARQAEAQTPIVAPSAPPKTVRTGMGTATVREDWTFEMVDAGQVPRQYLMLDVVAIRRAIRQDKVREIPGLRIFDRGGLTVR